MPDFKLSGSKHFTRPLPILETGSISTPQSNEQQLPRPNIALSKDRKRRLFPLVKYHHQAGNHDSNAPVEFTARARDEIKRTLFLKDNESHNNSRKTSNSLDNKSLYSSDSSLFSLPQSQMTDGSSILTQVKPVNTPYVPQTPLIPLVTEISLEHALPSDFSDMYTRSTLLTNRLLPNGRPEFTIRELIDWPLNDTRSLLIINELRPEWGNKLPRIIGINPSGPKYRYQLLPLYCSDEFIIETLVGSDIYLEANLDHEFKLRSATYIVKTARERHQLMAGGAKERFMTLQRFEWRNIIENYLLNLAVEAQCRYDFKYNCNEFKKWKMQQQGISIQDTQHKVYLSHKEKDMIWQQCQSFVYRRLNLDWKPDALNNI
ncbi:similar to Saccharomyces cerevisiae YDR277C MTH1 Negative regulator of the glucose-sensing signal transduction pathway, required for repression of transcription by Rgt1p [Maudiozyma saulgeensis]|uniref:Similar to Saccharomyces cerevisiae YDR277C MTH1 Negative regulator of the glucose-sensing signal transduction pathway, required for repression of transcription by Rgt1p n=1 Tax=Maudiozyma saulgeensis TaxID=1789683 RepID=A0A1X7R9J5_9SACH|nr:similar to Saccharomyces cerevisiae YDR277C MTH1 Negative regulator of the glucose-sensing signal transduction pathway, required for repression of transcription by Rgt1p [Kazachstania saulgeensis]